MNHYSNKTKEVLVALVVVVSLITAAIGQKTSYQIETGKFQPNWKSLEQFETPKWYRDAKFGIWAHWGPQCEPEQGDWYARNMYREGERQYKYHLANYGPPSEFGFKDIIHEWKAEKWNPDSLISLYKRAGAKYFFALANHHDNFDLWNSKYQEWNSVQEGPKKDIIKAWSEAAKKNGLYFGVSVHAARAWSWYNVSHGSDKTGKYAGIKYDGNLTKADGVGKWWNGLDPQELYTRPHDDKEKPDQAYIDKFFNRTKDLIDSYHPDLLYFDDSELPLGDAGLNIAAHYYNSNMNLHGGKLEAVLNTKGLKGDKVKTMVLDIERGRSDKIEARPWQTDTCIGNWHYQKGAKYKSATTVITTLADIISKNGNLLLSIPVRADGTIDSDETTFVKQLTAWMDVNGEAVFATRPWVIFGEGPTEDVAGGFSEGKAKPYTAQDIRFTTKGKDLYAFSLGWAGEGSTLTIKSLAERKNLTKIHSVKMLGVKNKLKFTRDMDGLKIILPMAKPCDHAVVFKIS
jgi:alpha-L-fucosidase